MKTIKLTAQELSLAEALLNEKKGSLWNDESNQCLLKLLIKLRSAIGGSDDH